MSKIYLNRKMKARQLVSTDHVRQLGIFSFKVRSQNAENVEYAVFNDGMTKFCECKDFELRQQDCKHIMAVDLIKYGMVKEVVA